MTRELLTILFILTPLGLLAQGFGTHWIGTEATCGDDSSQVWYRHTFVWKQKPLTARLTVATDGVAQVYLNGCLVSTDMPAVSHSKSAIISTLYPNVRRFLRADSNTVAVLYTPLPGHSKGHPLSVSLSGMGADGHRFSKTTGSDWLWRYSGSTVRADGSQFQDGRNNPGLYTEQSTDWACWQPVTLLPYDDTLSIRHNAFVYDATQVSQVLQPRYFDMEGDTVSYEFGTGFYGYLRVTLRGASNGETIHINDFTYICNGNMDEQAISPLPVYGREVTIRGDSDFHPEQITRVEVVNIADRKHQSYQH